MGDCFNPRSSTAGWDWYLLIKLLGGVVEGKPHESHPRNMPKSGLAPGSALCLSDGIDWHTSFGSCVLGRTGEVDRT